MKILLRMAAVLAFIFPFGIGAALLVAALSAPTTQDFWIPAAMGAFLIGNAVFVGGVLFAVAEKLGAKDGCK
jgi:hypothetical protein